MRYETKIAALYLLLSIAVTCGLYVPNIARSFVGIDIESYSKVFYSYDFIETTRLLFRDINGKVVVPGYYAPLSSMSLMFDKWLIGSQQPDPRFTALINLMFHCLNGVLIFVILKRVGVTSWAALTGSFIFLVHPVQVPVVQWFAERKTVMAAAFYFAAYIFYIDFRQTNSRPRYVAALAGFCLALLCKPTVVVLPLVLVMYELLNVMRGKGWIDRSAGKEPPALIAEGNEQKVQSGPHRLSTFLLVGFKREALLPLAPFLVIGAVFALLATKSEGPVPFDMPLISRPLIAASAIWFYLLKIIWPMNLMYIYPRWDAQVSSVLWWAPLVCVFLALAALYAWRQKIGGQFLWGLANFAVPLLPAIGLVKFGFLRLYYVADHFLYISMMGISLCISLVFLRFAVHARRLVRHATICIGLAYVVLLICQTWNQASTWKDPMTLWADNVKRCPSCSVAYNMLGYSLAGEGGYREAIPFYWKALQINPDSHESHNNLGTALFALGDTDKAIEQYRIAIRIRPDYVDAYYNLGNSMIKKGNIEEAAALYRTAIRINPDFAAAHNNLANALSALGKKSEAMKHYRTAIRLKPDFAEAYNNLGDEILRLVDQDDAPHRATEAKVTEPDPGDIVVDAGVPETKSGKLRLAKRYFEKALEIDPDQARARANLEIANSRLREISQADETGGQGKR